MSKQNLRILGFKTEHKPGREPVDWVHLSSADAITETGAFAHSTWVRIKSVTPPESIENDDGGLKMAALQARWRQIEPAYLAWKNGKSLPDDGTPLGSWPGVSPEQAEALRAAGIATVEQVASANETLLARPPLPGMRALQQQARAWLEGQDKAALQEELSRANERTEAMAEMMAELKAELAAMKRAKKAPARKESEDA